MLRVFDIPETEMSAASSFNVHPECSKYVVGRRAGCGQYRS